METAIYFFALLLPCCIAVVPYILKIYDNQGNGFKVKNIRKGGWLSIGLAAMLIIVQLIAYSFQQKKDEDATSFSKIQSQKIDSLKTLVSDLDLKYEKVIDAIKSKGLIYDSTKHEIVMGDKFQMPVTNNNTGNGKQYNNNVGKVDRIINK